MTHQFGKAFALILLAASLAAAAAADDATNPLAAQDHQLLLEACGTLKNVQRQSSCLDALARMEDTLALVPEMTPAEHAAARRLYLKKKYAAVIGAFAALKAATANKVSYEKYCSMTDATASEVASMRTRAASAPERQAMQQFDLAVAEYRQAEKNWDAAGKYGLPASAFVVPKWRLAREAVKQAESLLFESSTRSIP